MSSEAASPTAVNGDGGGGGGGGSGGGDTSKSSSVDLKLNSSSTTSSTSSLAALAAVATRTNNIHTTPPTATSAAAAAAAATNTTAVNLSDLILATDTTSSPMTQSTSGSSSGGGGMVLNEKVASLASSIYTELEKVIKAHGRDTVKDLMALVVNVLEALDVAYHEKEELSVDNELLKDDYEKLLSQYEREKQHRKDTELKLFQSEDTFAETRKEYEEKIKSLESIVRMIDLKSKNSSDHVMRLEEKENELKREYNKLHERYTELFKTHCDYMERTKLLFGYDQRLDSTSNHSTLQNNTSNHRSSGGGVALNKLRSVNHQQQQHQHQLQQQQQQQQNFSGGSSQNHHQNSSTSSMADANLKQLMDMLKSTPHLTLNKLDLVNALRNLSTQQQHHQKSGIASGSATAGGLVDLNSIISVIIQASSTGGIQHQQSQNSSQGDDANTTLVPNASSTSLTSLVSNVTQAMPTPNAQSTQSVNKTGTTQQNETTTETGATTTSGEQQQTNTENVLSDGGDETRLNLQSENFDEHLGNAEFDENIPDNTNSNKISTDLDAEYEGEYDGLVKNDLSLFNELSKENYDITELDDGADLTGMTREVANLIRENSELLQTKHALNVLKDDLIVRLDQFSNEMVILREEIRSLQTVKACLQLRITELEEEARKAKEELSLKTKKAEEEDESLPISQRKRFTRAEMARVLMERNQYKERLMDLQEAVRWTEMIRANKAAAAAAGIDSSSLSSTHGGHGGSTTTATSSSLTHEHDAVAANGSHHHHHHHHEHHKKRSALWRL